jgi:hypothetical protein
MWKKIKCCGKNVDNLYKVREKVNLNKGYIIIEIKLKNI